MKRTDTFREDIDRYHYDWGPCFFKKGWAQIDTAQDFCGFGMWTNPEKLTTITYCEGDEIIMKSETEKEYKEHIKYIIEWHKKNDNKEAKIDAPLERTRNKLIEMKLSQYLYKRSKK